MVFVLLSFLFCCFTSVGWVSPCYVCDSVFSLRGIFFVLANYLVSVCLLCVFPSKSFNVDIVFITPKSFVLMFLMILLANKVALGQDFVW